MSKGDLIQRLELLLERVRRRATEPRRSHEDLNGGDTEVTVHAVVSVGDRRPSTPEAPPDEKRDGHDSQERLVAAQPEPAEPAAVQAAPQAYDSVPPIEVTEVELVEEREEEEEEAPISSRRSVASEPEERLAQMAFGGEEPPQPLHTPPPESGRLPAAPTADFDADITGVRSATPILPRREEESLPRELVPEVMRGTLSSSDAVAELIAQAQRFAPSTFVALLDASLSLKG